MFQKAGNDKRIYYVDKNRIRKQEGRVLNIDWNSGLSIEHVLNVLNRFSFYSSDG